MWDGHGDGRERHLAPPLAARPPLGENGNLQQNTLFPFTRTPETTFLKPFFPFLLSKYWQGTLTGLI